MRLTFCTLFNRNYLSRALAMIESLKDCKTDFIIYILAFDDFTFNYLNKLNDPQIIPISLKEFEDPELLKVKKDRTLTEYCWTCSSSIILYCLNKFNPGHCTYIDADMIFYQDPSVLIEEMRDNAVLITGHRYTPQYDQSATSGIYCVQFVTFKNNEHGRKILQWWRDRCIEWCYARFEDGKFGDQKYLDDWPVRFEKVHVARHQGAGIAPWNLQQYSFEPKNNKLYCTLKETGRFEAVIFFHFHDLRFYHPDYIEITGSGYKITRDAFEFIYKPYIRKLINIQEKLFNEFSEDFQGTRPLPHSLKYFFLKRNYRNLKSGIKNLSLGKMPQVSHHPNLRRLEEFRK